MTTNADITIFNKRYDRTERTERFYGTKIKGVSLYFKKGVSSGDGGMSQDDKYIIRIPIDADTGGKQYVGQQEYKELSEKEFNLFWTLQPGAIIVTGLVEQNTATETELMQNFQEVIVVTNFTDNRGRGSESMWHWRVGGK